MAVLSLKASFYAGFFYEHIFSAPRLIQAMNFCSTILKYFEANPIKSGWQSRNRFAGKKTIEAMMGPKEILEAQALADGWLIHHK